MRKKSLQLFVLGLLSCFVFAVSKANATNLAGNTTYNVVSSNSDLVVWLQFHGKDRYLMDFNISPGATLTTGSILNNILSSLTFSGDLTFDIYKVHSHDHRVKLGSGTGDLDYTWTGVDTSLRTAVAAELTPSGSGSLSASGKAAGLNFAFNTPLTQMSMSFPLGAYDGHFDNVTSTFNGQAFSMAFGNVGVNAPANLSAWFAGNKSNIIKILGLPLTLTADLHLGYKDYCCTPPPSQVPEPASLALLGLGVAAIARRRRATRVEAV